MTLYIDNVSVLEGETPCTAVKIENAPTKMVKGMKLSMSADNFALHTGQYNSDTVDMDIQ